MDAAGLAQAAIGRVRLDGRPMSCSCSQGEDNPGNRMGAMGCSPRTARRARQGRALDALPPDGHRSLAPGVRVGSTVVGLRSIAAIRLPVCSSRSVPGRRFYRPGLPLVIPHAALTCTGPISCLDSHSRRQHLSHLHPEEFRIPPPCSLLFSSFYENQAQAEPEPPSTG